MLSSKSSSPLSSSLHHSSSSLSLNSIRARLSLYLSHPRHPSSLFSFLFFFPFAAALFFKPSFSRRGLFFVIAHSRLSTFLAPPSSRISFLLISRYWNRRGNLSFFLLFLLLLVIRSSFGISKENSIFLCGKPRVDNFFFFLLRVEQPPERKAKLFMISSGKFSRGREGWFCSLIRRKEARER